MGHYKQTFTNEIAIKAINTIIMYCSTHNCPNCILREDLKSNDYCLVSRLSCKKNFGFLAGDNSKTHAHKSPKFDGNLQLSQDFKIYLTTVLDRVLADEGIDSQDLVKHGEIAVKIKANGLVKVGAQHDGRVKILGKAKCHTDDAFNPEIGIKLAIERAAQAMHAPFVPEENEAYYYVGDENRIYSTINHNTNTDILNIAVRNCFKSRTKAHSNKDVITKRIAKAAKLLEKLREDDKRCDG